MSQTAIGREGAETPAAASAAPVAETGTAFAILLSLSFCHFLNDMIQSLVPAMYPILKENYALDFGQIGLITLAFQCTASLLQPLVGIVTDRRPMPYSLAIGMGSTLVGLLLLSQAHSYGVILVSAALIGVGSAVFHPESSRVARMASGGRYGLAQSLFQVGGNFGTAVGPLLAAFIVAPQGQKSLVLFSGAALLGMLVLYRVGIWYARRLAPAARKNVTVGASDRRLSRTRVAFAITVLVALVFSKMVYTAGLSSYYTFYLIERFQVSVETAQVLLFVYLGAGVLGALAGGAVGDRVGRLPVMWFSILGALPFTLALPYVGLTATVALTVVIGFVMASSFSAILVYAQDLMPGRVGLVAGLFFGFAFGLGGLGAAALGEMADRIGLDAVYRICSFLPGLGVLTALLPRMRGR
ncbi:MFS transporter [Roseomonas sp. CCTCC AB2023176]|uniref:MFS transporter n=1 Tax=Roseomonas sp. CCTCC AB2023176 TaxID=3342640 RepID=UPI0035DAA64D